MSTFRPPDPAAPASFGIIVNGRAVTAAGVTPQTTRLASPATGAAIFAAIRTRPAAQP